MAKKNRKKRPKGPARNRQATAPLTSLPASAPPPTAEAIIAYDWRMCAPLLLLVPLSALVMAAAWLIYSTAVLARDHWQWLAPTLLPLAAWALISHKKFLAAQQRWVDQALKDPRLSG